MRVIKFRFWDGARKIMFNEVTLIGCHWKHDQDPTVYVGHSEFDYGNERSVPNCSDGELMQYTGTKDMNGKEIYDGDRLFAKGNFEDSDYEYVGTVVWSDDDSKFKVRSFHGSFEYIPNGCVVMGNKYEEYRILEVEPIF